VRGAVSAAHARDIYDRSNVHMVTPVKLMLAVIAFLLMLAFILGMAFIPDDTHKFY
jgi:hypothetical protein